MTVDRNEVLIPTSDLKLRDIRLVIFDWSGVISDDRPPVYETNMRLLESHGRQRFSFDEWLPRTRMTVMEFLADHGVRGDPDVLFQEFRQVYSRVRAEGISPHVYPNAQYVLEALLEKGKKLMTVSSHPEENLRSEAKEYGVESFFEGFLGNMRDKAAGLLESCRKIRIEVPSAAYVGDTIYDIQAAKQAGLCSIGITTGYHLKDRLTSEIPDLLVDSLTELLERFNACQIPSATI